MATVGVLCTRVRVEEKQVMAALVEAGLRPQPIQPAGLPLPPFPSPTPLPPAPAMAGGLAGGIVLDRCHKRAAAAAILAALRAHGVEILDAGIAASGDRLAVATALARAGVPRPWTCLATCEASALAAVDRAGWPATLLPLAWDHAPVALPDRDTAEAVIEHRAVLGSGAEGLSLVQQGCAQHPATVFVVDGTAVAVERDAGSVSGEAIALAGAAARALCADVIGVVVADSAAGPVVWDVLPAPDFRGAAPIAGRSVAEAIAALVAARLATGVSFGMSSIEVEAAFAALNGHAREGVRDGVVLSA